jgi:hypothetical protein
MPAPLRADSAITGAWLASSRRWRSALAGSKSSSTSSRSDLLISIRSAARNITGYLAGLSSPSVTDSSVTLRCWPRSKLAGQTRLPTFSMNRMSTVVEVQFVQGVVHHVRIKMAGRPGRDLHRRYALVTDPLGIVLGLEVALDDRDPQAVAECGDRLFKQTGLAGSGR